MKVDMAYKGLNKLTPFFKEKVKLFINEVNKNGKIIFITETWRSEDRQLQLKKLGLSKVNHSLHQDGKAVDIAFYGEELYPKSHNKWAEVAKVARKYGIDWGYNLWKWDKVHFQDNGEGLVISKFHKVKANLMKELGIEKGIFNNYTSNKELTETEIKDLIDIAYFRILKE